MGTANGLLVAKLKIPSIIAALATNTIINGALRWYTNGAWISGLPEEFTDLGDVMPLPPHRDKTVQQAEYLFSCFFW